MDCLVMFAWCFQQKNYYNYIQFIICQWKYNFHKSKRTKFPLVMAFIHQNGQLCGEEIIFYVRIVQLTT